MWQFVPQDKEGKKIVEELNTRQILVIILVVLLSLLVLILWAPWLNAQSAERLAERRFETTWSEVAGGCSLNCPACGVVQTQRILTGYYVDLQYACDRLPVEDPGKYQVVRVLVSVFGTVHGVPQP